MSNCELTLAAAARDKATSAHSFQMNTERRSVTEKGATAGREISASWQQEKLEHSSTLNEQTSVVTDICDDQRKY